MLSTTNLRFTVPKEQYDDVVRLYRHYRRGFVSFTVATLIAVGLEQVTGIEIVGRWTPVWFGAFACAYGVLPYRARIAALVRRIAQWFRLIP